MKKPFFLHDKAFYTSFISLTIVIALNSLITFAVNLADNVMVGRYSEIALSGVALANQIHFVSMMVLCGVGNGIVVLGAQYWGGRQLDNIKRTISVGMKVAMAIGLIFTLSTLFFPHGILHLLTSDEAVIAEGMKYLRVMCWSYIIFSVSNTLVMSMRSVEVTMIGTIMSVVTLVINVSLNYLLIFGNLGFPELGTTGAAIATLASRIIELIVVVFYCLFIDKKLHLKLKDMFGIDMTLFKKYIKLATPMILSGLSWGVAQAAQTAVLGHMSQSAIAASSISGVVFQLSAVLALASASSSNVVTGKIIGSGRLDDVRPAAHSMQGMFIIIGCISVAVLYAVRGTIISFYSVTEETRELTMTFMNVIMVTIFGTAYEYPTSKGIVQGGGDTKYGFIVDTVMMWAFAIPGAALSAFVFHWKPIVTFSILKADQVIKCIPNAIKCNRFKWVKQLSKPEAAQ